MHRALLASILLKWSHTFDLGLGDIFYPVQDTHNYSCQSQHRYVNPVCGRNHKMSQPLFFLHAAITCNVTANHRQQYQVFITFLLTSGYRNLAPKDKACFNTRYYRSISVCATNEPKFGTQPYTYGLPTKQNPYSPTSRLKDKLDSMEKNGIICKVTEPNNWVNALVTVEKPKSGKLRVCLHPRPLNKDILRPHYPLPTLEDVTTKLAGVRYLSVLDARAGYWAIKLINESSMLTTFNTVFDRYCFLRMPFGIISQCRMFQRRVDETYEGLQWRGSHRR